MTKNGVQLQISRMLSGDIQRMADTFRWPTIPVLKKESSAEHSYYVALYSLMIADDLDHRGIKVNFGKLLARALMHDVDEAVSGDMLRGFKYADRRLPPLVHKVCRGLLKETLDDLCGSAFSKRLLDTWEQSKDSATLEGTIVQAADFLSSLAYVFREVLMGNKMISRFEKEVRGCLRTFAKKLGADHPLAPYLEQIEELDASCLMKFIRSDTRATS